MLTNLRNRYDPVQAANLPTGPPEVKMAPKSVPDRLGQMFAVCRHPPVPRNQVWLGAKDSPKTGPLAPNLTMQKRPAILFVSFLFATLAAHFCMGESSLAAQPREGKEPSVDLAIGGAMTGLVEGGSATSGGLYLSTSYSVPLEPFVGLRAYGGLLFTFPSGGRDEEECGREECNVSVQGMLLGGKARVAAPIPWVAPFAEAGVGLTLGAVTTQTAVDDIRLGPAGATIHVPLAFGVALGTMRETELAVQAIFHPEAKQYTATLSIAVCVPVDVAAPPPAHDKPWWKFF